MDANSERLLSTVRPELQQRWRMVEQGARARGVGITIHSGLRNTAQQQALWNNRASNPNPVARPGTSPHEFGVAIDATPIPRTSAAWNVLWDEARRAGLVLGKNFSRSDPPHFELPGFVHGAGAYFSGDGGASLPELGGFPQMDLEGGSMLAVVCLGLAALIILRW
jgi:hypothetical protein